MMNEGLCRNMSGNEFLCNNISGSEFLQVFWHHTLIALHAKDMILYQFNISLAASAVVSRHE